MTTIINSTIRSLSIPFLSAIKLRWHLSFFFAFPLATNCVAEVDYLTELTLEELLQVQVVSVNKRPESYSESASSIQVVLNEQIHRSSASNIPEALRLATNLNVAQQSAHEWIISARGFSSDVGNKLLVLMDGRSIYTPLFSGVFWDRQDYILDDLERIEVISGPGGTIWGANAVNGVINIVSKSSQDTQGWYTKVSGGTLLDKLASVRYGGSINQNSHFRVYAKGSEYDDQYLSDGSRASDNWSKGQFGFRTDHQLTERDLFTFQGDFYSLTSTLQFGEESKTKGGNLLFRWDKSFSNTSDIQLQVYYDYSELKLPSDELVINGTLLSTAGTFEDRLDTYDIDFSHWFHFGDRQKIIWGIEYRLYDDQTINTDGLGFQPDHVEQELYSVFIQDEIALIKDTLLLTLGTKIEYNVYTDEEVEPSIRLSYKINSHNTLWTAISKAVRIPSRIDTDFSQPYGDGFVLLQGNPNFKPEELIAYELGFRSQTNQSVLTSIALFYNDYDNLRSTDLSDTTIFPLYFSNDLEGHTYGIEVNINWQATDWSQITVGYNNLQQDLSVQSGGYDFNNTYNETADPEHQFYLRAAFDIGEKIDVDINYRYIDSLPTNNAGVLTYVPNYNELDLHLAWQLNNTIELSLSGQNLLHKHHHEFGIPSNQQSEIGRNIYASVIWNL